MKNMAGETPRKQRTSGLERNDPIPPSGLTSTEQDLLVSCEVTLTKGLQGFLEVGNALLTIRDKGLYRIGYRTFEEYCRCKWDISRSYAHRLIGATERVQLLPATSPIPRPTSEFQIRPLLKLDPKDFPKIWERAVKEAKGAPVTIRHVQQVAPRTANKTQTSSRRSAWIDLHNILCDVKTSLKQNKVGPAVKLLDEAIDIVENHASPQSKKGKD